MGCNPLLLSMDIQAVHPQMLHGWMPITSNGYPQSKMKHGKIYKRRYSCYSVPLFGFK